MLLRTLAVLLLEASCNQAPAATHNCVSNAQRSCLSVHRYCRIVAAEVLSFMIPSQPDHEVVASLALLHPLMRLMTIYQDPSVSTHLPCMQGLTVTSSVISAQVQLAGSRGIMWWLH